jgi:hypothetical protein
VHLGTSATAEYAGIDRVQVECMMCGLQSMSTISPSQVLRFLYELLLWLFGHSLARGDGRDCH